MIIRSSLLVFALATLGCGDHGHDDEAPAECQEIIEACHDAESDAGQERHVNAEARWSASECTANTASCVATCEAAP